MSRIALCVGVIRRIYDLVRIDIDIDAVRLELVNILCKALGKGLAVDLYLRVLLDVDERVALNDREPSSLTSLRAMK